MKNIWGKFLQFERRILRTKQNLLFKLAMTGRRPSDLATFCGFNNVKRFYQMPKEYQRLKRIVCKICTVCGSRRRTPVRKLKDAKQFLHLLELTESEVERFEALVHFVGDRIGKLAQMCFHIEKIGDKYYFILDLDEDKFYSKQGGSEEHDYSLVKEGKLTKLPACESCFIFCGVVTYGHPNILIISLITI